MKIKIAGKIFEVSKEQLESNPEEVVIESDVIIRTPDEDATFVENQKKAARIEGEEIAVKKHRETYGFEGRSVDKLIEAVTKKTLEEAKVEPAEQVKKLTKKLEEKEEALGAAINKSAEIENKFNVYKDEQVIMKTDLDSIPDKTVLPKEDVALILMQKMEFAKTENGSIGVKRPDGTFEKDKTTANELPAKAVIEDYFRSNPSYISGYKGPGSEGSDDTSGSGKMTMDDFIKHQKEKGFAPNSAEFTASLQEAIKTKTVELDD